MTTLTSIGSGHRLAADAAASYQRTRAAGCPAGITSAYRDPAEQAELRRRYLAGTFPNYAAPPEASDHCKGLALDLPTGPRQWMRAHGAAYGWQFTDPKEPWHVAYRAATDSHRTAPTTTTTPITMEDTDMLALARLKTSPDVYVGNGITRRHVANPVDLADIQSMMRLGVIKGDPKVHEVANLGWLGVVVK